MTPPLPRRARVALASLAAAALTTGAVSSTATAAEPDPNAGVIVPAATAEKGTPKKTERTDTLGSHDRALLAQARAKGEKRVTIMVATTKGSTASVAAAVRAVGGVTATVSARYGYLSASVPTDRVDAVAKSASVLAVDLNESIPLPRPEALGTGEAAAAAVVGPGASTPDDNPYMPTRDTGSVAFKTANPTWDGRGVTIGVLDSGVDLDHPALQKTSTGERKVVDWVTGTDPLLESDGSWRAMLTAVSGPTFTASGSTWTAPRAGSFRFNRVAENISLNDEAGGDFNRDKDTTDRWGILYDEATHDIWVDANQDLTFSDSELMRPYKERFDVGHFGVDDPATPVAESMPFVVEYREDVDLTPAGLPGQKADFVNIGIVEAAHGTPRRRHRGRPRPLRRGDGRSGARRQDRVDARLLVGRRLHGGRPDRRHGRPRREPRRRRRQHVDRRPARPQRRQQRPRPPLRPAHRRWRPARHLGRQQRTRHQHHR